MQSVVFDPDTDVGYGKQVTMAVTFSKSNTEGFVSLGFPNESGGMFGAQVVVAIPQYKIIVKYDLKVYVDQALLLDKQ